MKKLLVVVIIVGLFVGGMFLVNNKKVSKDSLEIDEFPEEKTSDMFNDYYNDASKLMSKMTLEEKVGQLFLVRYENVYVTKQITKYYPGGYILFAKDFDNHTKSSIKSELNAHQSESKIPLIFGVDEEGGYVTRVSRYKAFRDSKFLSPRSYYEQGGYELVKSMEDEKAKLLLSLGLNLNLAPVADLSTDINDFINIRTFGRDAKETSVYISNMVGYANKGGIASCLKHFPGYGNNADTHTGSAYDKRSYETFTTGDYLPFIGGINAGVPTIMVSHNVMECVDSTYPASLSSKVINELREKLGFSGIIMTDDLVMDAIKDYAKDGSAAVLAINAGNDMITTTDFETMYNIVLNAVKNGDISEKIIDKAVKRILAFKYQYKIIK